MKTIGIDLGGTRIKGIVMDADRNILHQLYTFTNDGDGEKWKEAVAATVRQLESVSGEKAVKIGISAPGLPNPTNTAIACMPGRLQGLEHFDWSSFLERKAMVLNDAIAALVAEAKLGVASSYKHVVMLTLGTGVGGAILIDGKPYQGAFNKAGHIGHMVIDHLGAPDVTGMPGSLEDAIGNCTIETRSSGSYQSTHQLLADMRKGNAGAKKVWLQSVRQLAMGIASITNILSPELIVLGGGITEAGPDLFDPLDEYMSVYEWRPTGDAVKIVKAKFGDMAGATGAACYAMDND